MRPRLVAVFVLLTAVLGGLLTGASAAHAQAPDDPVCRPALTNTPDIVCTVPVKADGRNTDFIGWTSNGDPLLRFNNIRNILVSCEPGETLEIELTIIYSLGVEETMGDTRITCPDRRTAGIRYLNCDSGAALVVCTAQIDGTPPFSTTWTMNGVEQTYFKNSSTLRVGCVVGRPFDVQLAVTDAAGTSAADRARGFCRRIQE
ncbi:hypothetical protein ACIBEJ_51330 [Nonomuraea sp. NPDC050790]|uniref:hypothetical protein n=1 Tax=Nonomuraea sp. NPDC050790 TaxID=3364371 RepID=UPI0037AE2FC0